MGTNFKKWGKLVIALCKMLLYKLLIISADDKLMLFFFSYLFFPEKRVRHLIQFFFLKRQLALKCFTLFSWENINLSSADLAHRVVKVNFFFV